MQTLSHLSKSLLLSSIRRDLAGCQTYDGREGMSTAPASLRLIRRTVILLAIFLVVEPCTSVAIAQQGSLQDLHSLEVDDSQDTENHFPSTHLDEELHQSLDGDGRSLVETAFESSFRDGEGQTVSLFLIKQPNTQILGDNPSREQVSITRVPICRARDNARSRSPIAPGRACLTHIPSSCRPK